MVSRSSTRAVVLDAVPALPEALVIRERPVPEPEPGCVLIEVKAIGLNRSELTIDERATSHDDMEHDRVAGKLVVSTGC